MSRHFEAVIFDMDGVLIDSEPLWQEAEIDLFSQIGVRLTRRMCETTMGLRIDEVVAHWKARHPWGESPTENEMVAAVVDRMVELVGERGVPRPGVGEALDACRSRGLRLALATSSYRAIMEASLDALGLQDVFEVAHSGEQEPLGKPHPGIYLTVASALGVPATRCIAIEDSVAGVISAKAARMTCVAVPDIARGDERFAVADAVIDGLADFPAWLEDVVPVDEEDGK